MQRLDHVFAAVDQQMALNAMQGGLVGALGEGSEDEPVPPSRVRAAAEYLAGEEQEDFTQYNKIAKGRRAEWMSPAYPRVPLRFAAKIALGMSPLQIALEQDPEVKLTKAEAHEWLQAGGQPAAFGWWIRRHLPEGTPHLRSWDIAKWLKSIRDRGAWGALLKERRVHAPGGQELTFRYIDKLDEIQDEDLVRGPKTGVDAAFEHAAERVGDAWYGKAIHDHRILNKLPPGWELPEHIRLLDTPAKLAREGKELNHCVGGYIPAVESGQSVILGVEVPGECRSTAELTRKGKVRQHYGAGNSTPVEPCKSIFEKFVTTLSPLNRYPGYKPDGGELAGADLRGADLDSVSLVRANLRGANLEGANLMSAKLNGADLTGANLKGAKLNYADLNDVNFQDADLTDAGLIFGTGFAPFRGGPINYLKTHPLN